MPGRKNCWGIAVGFLCATASVGWSTEPIVQDFDGWKITIRPGQSSLPVPFAVPPSPGFDAAATASKGAIKLASLNQEVPALSSAASPPAPVTVPGTPPIEPIDGLPVIIPGESSGCCDPAPLVDPPAGTVDPRYLSQMYTQIYQSIPFNRAEYNANPSYRHDTAVEFLFGKMRPTVIHRGTTNVNHNYPSGYNTPYVYGGLGYGYGGLGYGDLGYGYPPLQLVIPGVGMRVHRSY